MRKSDRLERIIQNLKTSSALDGQFLPPKQLHDRMEQLHTPAVSLAIIDDYKLAESGTYGFSDTKKQSPVLPETLFLAGSISKSIFATAVMSLVSQNKLDLDEDINRYLSSWKVPANDDWQPRISLRQILSHTAGLTVHGFPGYLPTDPIPTMQQILNGEAPANTPAVRVNRLPGIQFCYSGGGTTIAQLALCDYFNERSFPALMHRLVFGPLNMTNSTFDNPLLENRVAQAAKAYPWRGIPLSGDFPVYPEMAAAGLWTTPIDLAKFGIELLNCVDGRSDRLMKQSVMLDMLKPQLPDELEAATYAGLGFFCTRKDDSITFSHGGWDDGFVCELCLHSNTGKGAIVMLNSNEGHPILGELFKAISEEYSWPEKPAKVANKQLSNLEKFSGSYQTDNSQIFGIEVNESVLTLQFDKQMPVSFYPTSETNFLSSMINTKLTFDIDHNNKITSMAIEQNGHRFKAVKQN